MKSIILSFALLTTVVACSPESQFEGQKADLGGETRAGADSNEFIWDGSSGNSVFSNENNSRNANTAADPTNSNVGNYSGQYSQIDTNSGGSSTQTNQTNTNIENISGQNSQTNSNTSSNQPTKQVTKPQYDFTTYNASTRSNELSVLRNAPALYDRGIISRRGLPSRCDPDDTRRSGGKCVTATFIKNTPAVRSHICSVLIPGSQVEKYTTTAPSQGGWGNYYNLAIAEWTGGNNYRILCHSGNECLQKSTTLLSTLTCKKQR